LANSSSLSSFVFAVVFAFLAGFLAGAAFRFLVAVPSFAAFSVSFRLQQNHTMVSYESKKDNE
jgi:hypothetical protein